MTVDMSNAADRLKHSAVQYNAGRHLALHAREPNGSHVWRAYLEYRRHGIAVPESILSILDGWASRAIGAKTDSEVATAFEMGTVGRQGAARRADAARRRRDIVEEFYLRHLELGKTRGIAAKAMASGRGDLTIGRVRTIVTRWEMQAKIKARRKQPAGSDLQAVVISPMCRVT